jgi:nitrate/TMAO reductase-like tetraheme cytochrome c subunit
VDQQDRPQDAGLEGGLGPHLRSIDTRDKFLAMRKHLAEREWERMKANDSLECRNCHSSESMDL